MPQTHPSTATILRYFEYDQLPAHLRDVSQPFRELAHDMTRRFDGPELTAGLRKLLEAKECMIRAAQTPRSTATDPGSGAITAR